MSTENVITRNSPIMDRKQVVETVEQQPVVETTPSNTEPIEPKPIVEKVQEAVQEIKTEPIPESKPDETKSDPAAPVIEWEKEANTLKGSLTEMQSKYAELQAKHEDLKTKSNPKTWFANEVEMKKQIILKENPKMNSYIVDKILDTNLEKANPIDVLALNILRRNGSIINGEQGARDLAINRLGFDTEDFNYDQLNTIDKNKILDAASEAKVELEKIQNVNMPDIPDFELEYAQTKQQQEDKKAKLTDAWRSSMDKLIESSISKLDFDDFTFVVDDNYRNEIKSLALQYAVQNKVDFTEEGIQNVVNFVDVHCKNTHLNNIVSKAREYERSKVKIETSKELDHPKPITEQVAPVETKEDPEVSRMRKALYNENSSSDFVRMKRII